MESNDIKLIHGDCLEVMIANLCLETVWKE
jgi:hypothetical protein